MKNYLKHISISSIGNVLHYSTYIVAQEFKQDERCLSMDFNWRFYLGDIPGANNPEFNDTDWRLLNIPHDWSIEGEFSEKYASGTGYLPGGIGWYRKEFTIPETDKKKHVEIVFDGIYENSEVWINGFLSWKTSIWF